VRAEPAANWGPSDDGADFFADSPARGVGPIRGQPAPLNEAKSEQPEDMRQPGSGDAQAPLPAAGGAAIDPGNAGGDRQSVSPFTAMSAQAPNEWGHDQEVRPPFQQPSAYALSGIVTPNFVKPQ
jgi:hypothetical protein